MGITFAPPRGAILLCNFGPDPSEGRTYPCHRPPLSVSPGFWKHRRVVVVSANQANHRHGRAPGVCSVIPFSSTPPRTQKDWDVFFPMGAYRSFTRPVWAKCAGIMHVSHERLDRVAAGRGFLFEVLKREDMTRLEAGLSAVLGLNMTACHRDEPAPY